MEWYGVYSISKAEERVKSDVFLYTWSDYTEKIVSMILAWYASINDPYDYAESIKDESWQLTPAVYIYKVKVQYHMHYKNNWPISYNLRI